MKITSKKNRTPLTMANQAFHIARLYVSVLKAEWTPCSQSFKIKAPVAMNNAHPIKLKKMSMRLLIGVLRMYPKTKYTKYTKWWCHSQIQGSFVFTHQKKRNVNYLQTSPLKLLYIPETFLKLGLQFVDRIREEIYNGGPST